MSGHLPPPGFEVHDRRSPVTDPWAPIYIHRAADAVRLGLVVREAHTNSRGLLHGGLIAALADNAMGLSLGQWLTAQDRRPERGLLTTSLSLDYLDLARIGEWLEVATGFHHASARRGVAQALVTAGGRVIARANAAFAIA